jgi:hypothetical protein
VRLQWPYLGGYEPIRSMAVVVSGFHATVGEHREDVMDQRHRRPRPLTWKAHPMATQRRAPEEVRP